MLPVPSYSKQNLYGRIGHGIPPRSRTTSGPRSSAASTRGVCGEVLSEKAKQLSTACSQKGGGMRCIMNICYYTSACVHAKWVHTSRLLNNTKVLLAACGSVL